MILDFRNQDDHWPVLARVDDFISFSSLQRLSLVGLNLYTLTVLTWIRQTDRMLVWKWIDALLKVFLIWTVTLSDHFVCN